MEKNSEEYDSFDSTYDEKPDFFGHPYIELQEYFQNCPIRGNLLDLGCGQGRDSLFLASIGYNVTAVDISKVGIGQMIKKAQSRGLCIEGIVGDVNNLNLGQKFNVILIDMLLHGLEDSVQLNLLKKCTGFLKQNGLLCIVYPDDFTSDHFMKMLKELPGEWKLLDEITINDIPKIGNETIDFKFKMMVSQITK